MSRYSGFLKKTDFPTFRWPSAESVIYFGSLLACMGLGKFYKNINDITVKKNYGAGLGLLVTFAVFGNKAVYSVLTVCANVIIIKCCNRRYVHQLSICFTFLLMIYLHDNVLNTMYLKFMYQLTALRMVGVAFSVHRLDKKKQESQPLEEVSFPDPNVADLVCFGFCFIGIHKGPFYRYKIFYDHFTKPFGIMGDCKLLTGQVIRNAIVCSVLYFILDNKFPSDMYERDEFYTDYSSDYRFMYNLPQLVIYLLHFQTMLLCCTGVFTETGFGVYPAKTQSWPGHGPSTNFELLEEAASNPELAMELEYNFHTLQSFDYTKILVGPQMKDTMRGWDMTTRYWFWTNMYKSLVPKGNKEVRSACSFLGWTIWSGSSVVQALEAMTFWVYIHLEAEYADLYNTSEGDMKASWDVGFWIMRLMCIIYLTPCFVYDNTGVILRYYNSIYWIYHVLLFSLMWTAIAIYKFRAARTQHTLSALAMTSEGQTADEDTKEGEEKEGGIII